MPNTKTVRVPHLGGIDAAYQMPHEYDPSKPTLVLVNSFTTSSELYRTQFKDKRLTDAMNVLAIELLGHGQTRTECPQFTYWDTAIMNLQVLQALGIKQAYALGTSQGGWVVARMALLAPDVILGIIPLGTAMDKECERMVKAGCWDGMKDVGGAVDGFYSLEPTRDFAVPDSFCDFLIDAGFGKEVDQSEREFWMKEMKANYQGDDGRARLYQCAVNLRDRDGLHARVPFIKCPVLWLHGTSDAVYSVANAEEEIKLFKSSSNAKLQVVEGGQHFLSASHPEEVAQAILGFVKK